MSDKKLEERLAALEQRVAELEARLKNGAPEKDWQSTVGMFSGDETMKRITAAALEYREKDREKARRRFAREDAKAKAKEAKKRA